MKNIVKNTFTILIALIPVVCSTIVSLASFNSHKNDIYEYEISGTFLNYYSITNGQIHSIVKNTLLDLSHLQKVCDVAESSGIKNKDNAYYCTDDLLNNLTFPTFIDSIPLKTYTLKYRTLYPEYVYDFFDLFMEMSLEKLNQIQYFNTMTISEKPSKATTFSKTHTSYDYRKYGIFGGFFLGLALSSGIYVGLKKHGFEIFKKNNV